MNNAYIEGPESVLDRSTNSVAFTSSNGASLRNMSVGYANPAGNRIFRQ